MILEQERRKAEAEWAAQEDRRLRAEFEREKARRAAEEAAIRREQEAERRRKTREEQQRRRAQAALLEDRQKMRGQHQFREESYNVIERAPTTASPQKQSMAPVKRPGGIRLVEELSRANAEAAKAVEAAKAAIAAAAEAAAVEAAIAKALEEAKASATTTSKPGTTTLPPS